MRTTIFAAVVLLASALSAPAQVPLGSEFRVDTGGSVAQFTRTRSMAMAPDGRFVVAWARLTSLPDDWDVVARRFDAAGVAQGLDFVVNTDTSRWQYDPSVGIDDAGNFVVVWNNTFLSAIQGTFGQRYDASGQRRGGQFLVRDSSDGSGGTEAPSVAVAPTGEYLVVWMEWAGGPPVSNVLGQRFDAAGAPVGAAFRVNDATTIDRARRPMVDADGSGNFVVVWHEADYPRRVLGRRFSSGGTPLGAEFQVNANSAGGPAWAAVASGRDGSFVVAWELAQTPAGGIVARRFDPSGLPVGGELAVAPSGNNPAIDMDADGDFAVAWSGRPYASNSDVFAARFLSSGFPAGPTFRVNTYARGTQALAMITSDPAGNFVVAWRSAGQNGVDAVFAQRYAGGLSAAALVVDGSAVPTSDGNGVFEAGETVTVAPSWLNANVGAETFTGAASSFTGPGTPGDPTYTVADGAASYGTVASNATGMRGNIGLLRARYHDPEHAAGSPLGRHVRRGHLAREPGRGEDLGAAYRRQLCRRTARQRLLQVRGDGAAPRHHRGLQPHSVLPRRLDDPRADGRVRPRGEGRPG